MPLLYYACILNIFLDSSKLSIYRILAVCLLQTESFGTCIRHNVAGTYRLGPHTEEVSIKNAPKACCKHGLFKAKSIDKTKTCKHRKDCCKIGNHPQKFIQIGIPIQNAEHWGRLLFWAGMHDQYWCIVLGFSQQSGHQLTSNNKLLLDMTISLLRDVWGASKPANIYV